MKEIAHRSGKPFKRKSARRPRRYRLESASLGNPLFGIDLDKALQLADSLEDHDFRRYAGLAVFNPLEA